MPFVGASSFSADRRGRNVIVRSPFWSVTHDLDRGGAPVAIRFAHGGDGNILTRPLHTRVDEWSDVDESVAAPRLVRTPDGIRLTFRGRRFSCLYDYTPYWIRREMRVRVPSGAKLRDIRALAATFDDPFTHWSASHDPRTKSGRAARLLGPHYDGDDGEIPEGRGVFFEDPHPAGWASLYRLGGEGIQISPAGALDAWDSPFAMRRTGRGIEIDFGGNPSARGEADELVFAAFVTLCNLPAHQPRPLRTVMVGNPPFPSDQILRAWARSGVQLIVIMEGASWGRLSGPHDDRADLEYRGWGLGRDRFWRTGATRVTATRATCATSIAWSAACTALACGSSRTRVPRTSTPKPRTSPPTPTPGIRRRSPTAA
jgi:hypothetical protein